MTIQKRAKICIVDDDLLSAMSLKRALDDEYECHVLTDSPAAFAQIKELHPDIVMMDVGMPEVDGFDVCKRLKRNQSTAGIPVIFVSGRSEHGEEYRAFAGGADDFVAKPVDVTKLKARAQRALISSLYIGYLENLVRHKDQAINALKNDLHERLDHV